MKLLLAIGLGGGLGAICRHLLATAVSGWLGASFPWGILAVNALGCFAMGLLVEAFALVWSPPQLVRAFLTVGLLGGFTTFSSFSLDAMTLAERGELAGAAAYVAASVVLCLAGIYLAMRLMRLVLA